MEEQPKRIVDTQTFLPVLIDLVREGHTVALTITGHSMTPFLVHGRDQIRFCRPDHPLKRGDMAFFRRRNGAYVMHRICRVDREGRYYLVGDEQTVIEGPILPEQVFGVVTQVFRKGRWIGPGDFWWDFFAGPWLSLLPLRPMLRRVYGLFARMKRGEPAHADRKG